MADEHEDGIERLRHDGRVHRWSRRDSAWPGHTTFVALRGGEVVMGDRYAGEALERTYACHPQALLEGCFAALVSEQLGPRVLEELVAEVRHMLGVPPDPIDAAARPEAAAKPTRPAKPTKARVEPQVAPEAIPEAGVSAQVEAIVVTHPVDVDARVDVAVVRCGALDLPLIAALRGVTRAPVKELLGRLRQLPCTILSGVTRAQADGVRERLAELGATVELGPASA